MHEGYPPARGLGLTTQDMLDVPFDTRLGTPRRIASVLERVHRALPLPRRGTGSGRTARVLGVRASLPLADPRRTLRPAVGNFGRHDSCLSPPGVLLLIPVEGTSRLGWWTCPAK